MTKQEKRTLIEDRQYYIDCGYPVEVAEQRAFNHLSVNRQVADGWFKGMFYSEVA